MMRSTGLFAVALSLGAAAPVQPDARQVRTLLNLEREWNRAVVDKNVAALDRILADDFKLVWVNGATSGKADILRNVADRKASIDPFETAEVDVRIYDRTAIVVGRFTQTARLGGQSETINVRYTDVYRRHRNGRRAVSAHATLIR